MIVFILNNTFVIVILIWGKFFASEEGCKLAHYNTDISYCCADILLPQKWHRSMSGTKNCISAVIPIAKICSNIVVPKYLLTKASYTEEVSITFLEFFHQC